MVIRPSLFRMNFHFPRFLASTSLQPPFSRTAWVIQPTSPFGVFSATDFAYLFDSSDAAERPMRKSATQYNNIRDIPIVDISRRRKTGSRTAARGERQPCVGFTVAVSLVLTPPPQPICVMVSSIVAMLLPISEV